VLVAFVWTPGQIDAYYQYMLKPYDVAAGIVILEEAGGRVTTADGAAYSVFDRSLLATNDALYEQVMCRRCTACLSVSV
jgi:myo-inositol-1(or 4)-monophosphatase